MEQPSWKNGSAIARVGVVLFLIWVVGLGAAGCSEESTVSGGEEISFWEIPIDGVIVRLELALSEEDMARGLMFRERLEAGHGMLFLYREPRKLSFWMRNTPLPLDLAFFDGTGTIREIRKLYPFDETPVLSVSDEIVGAIELGRGEFTRLGIGVGSRIDRKALTGAIQQSGAGLSGYVYP